MNLDIYGHMWTWRDDPRPSFVECSRFPLISELNRTNRFKHPFWVLDYFWNATHRFRVGSRQAPWQDRPQSSLLLMPPNTTYWREYTTNRPSAVCVYVKLANGQAAGLGELIGLHQRYGLFLDPEGETGALLDQMAHIGHDYGEGGFWRAYSAFSLLIARLQESEPVEAGVRRIIPRAPAPEPSALVQAMDRYLTENFARRVTLADLARALGVSVSLLTHRIRKETGEPPLQRLLRLRLQRAKIFIAAGQSLKVVAEATGFYDAFHLSHTFKQAEGVSPREFLKQFYGKDRDPDDQRRRSGP